MSRNTTTEGSKKKSKKVKNSSSAFNQFLGIFTKLLFIVVLIFCGLLLAKESYTLGYRIFAEEAVSSKEDAKTVTVSITDTMSNKEIAELMERKGLVNDAILFYIQLSISDFKDSVVPGIYSLSTDMTYDEILETIGNETDSEEEE